MLGLYLHLPFCATHCTYCPFAISTDLALQGEYTDALIREIEAASRRMADGRSQIAEDPAIGHRPSAIGHPVIGHPVIDTLYFGGGTPSRTSLENLTRVFAALRAHFAFTPGMEITFEANPEDVTDDALRAWRELGVNRLSIGVQSFHDAELAAIGRIHDRARAIEAIQAAVASGMRASLDLILGLPQQTAESFRQTLDTAVALGAGHLSLYMLDLEERTPLEVQVARKRVILPDDDLVADLYVEAVARLDAAGLHQYEISNFARPGQESQHNLRYWRRAEYLGFGMGAHSFTGDERYANTRDIRRYIELAPHARDFAETLGPDEVRRETIFLGLRQAAGVCYEDLVALCGQEGIEWTEHGLADGWLQRKGGRVAFTPSGFLQSNDYMSRLF